MTEATKLVHRRLGAARWFLDVAIAFVILDMLYDVAVACGLC